MSRPYYDHGYGGPDYYSEDPSSRQSRNQYPQSRIPRPGFAGPDRMRGPPPMRPDHVGASHGRSPRRVVDPYQQIPHQHYPQSNSWQTSQNLCDGSAFDYQEDYGQNDQWPLPAAPNAHSPRNNGSSPRRPPPRPQRPDEQSPRHAYQHRPVDAMRASPQLPSPSRPQQQPLRSGPSHHGSGQWTGDGYVYAPPPSYPLPSRPLPSIAASPTDGSIPIPAYPGPQISEHVALAQANRRIPLGPPPSARRGPSSYYPQVGPVHPIVEETDSMRGSVRTGSAYTGGHDSKTSFASSNAIPIGISQLHLDSGREAATHQPIQRPAPLSDSEDDDYEDSPTEPAIARGEIRTPEPMYTRDPPSPEVTVVRQASLGKKSKPTLTTVKSSNSVRRSSGDARNALAYLPSQQRDSPRLLSTSSEDPIRTEESRALAEEALTGHAQAGAQDSPVRSITPGAPQPVVSPSAPVENSPAVTTAAAYMKEAGFKQESRQKTPEKVSRAHVGEYEGSLSEKALEQGLTHKRSKELLGADLSSQLHPQRSRARSPLAPAVDPRVDSIPGSLEKGGALSAEEAQELKQPMGGLSERSGKRRPPRLNVDAVRDAEARGSLTSLPDLIRRATKLASNLDRGKTASRMGMNWIDGAHDDEKRRSGSISDILASFPPPAPDSRNGFRRSLATWSTRNRHSALPSVSDAGDRKQRRRCCGMPLWLFIVLVLVLVLLVAAAVIVPVVLIVIPNQNETGSTKVGSCAAAPTCDNGGTNIMSSNGQCECLCVNQYTGPTCSTFQQAGCTTISTGVSDTATVGEALPRILNSAGADFSIALDTQELLGLFSSQDLNCNTQNQLVTFNSQSSKRSLETSVESNLRLPRRQESASNTVSTTDDGTDAASGTAVSSSAPAAATSSSSPNNKTVDFARVAVLYILQDTQELHAASDAQENLQQYFRTGSTNPQPSATAQNVALGNAYSCDLVSYTINTSNGTTVGRSTGSSNTDS